MTLRVEFESLEELKQYLTVVFLEIKPRSGLPSVVDFDFYMVIFIKAADNTDHKYLNMHTT